MAQIRYSERCPHCKQLFWWDDYERPRAFHCTLRLCLKCGNTFLDSKWYEWENLTNEEKKVALVTGYGYTITTEVALRKQIKLNYIGAALLIGISALKSNKKLLAKLEAFKFDPSMLQDKEIQESIKRTSDPAYRKALLDIGHDFYGPLYEDR